MTEPASGDLATLLQQLRLQSPHAASPSAATDAGIELLLTRISTLTTHLRAQPADDASRAMVRLLLADLAMVAAHFRGDMTTIGDRLAHALGDIQDAVERAGVAPPIDPD